MRVVLENVAGSVRLQCLRHDRRIALDAENKEWVCLAEALMRRINSNWPRLSPPNPRSTIATIKEKELISSFKIGGAKDRPDSGILQDAPTSLEGDGMELPAEYLRAFERTLSKFEREFLAKARVRASCGTALTAIRHRTRSVSVGGR
jgi:hypothetical protein